MKENRIAVITAVIFGIIAVVAASARILFEEKKITGLEKKAWILVYRIDINSMAPDARLTVRIPRDTRHYRIANETFSYKNLSVSFDTSKQQDGRRIIAVQLSKTNPSQFTAEIEIRRRTGKPKQASLTAEDRQYYLRESPNVQVNAPEFIELRDRILRSKPTRNKLIGLLFQHIQENIEVVANRNATDAVSALVNRQSNTVGKARAMLALARTAKIPTRMVTGFILDADQETKPHQWLEIYYKKQWHAFDPTYGHEWTVPADYLAVARNVSGITSATGVFVHEDVYDISDITAQQVTVRKNSSLGQLFNLERLPIGMRNVVAVVLLLPLGVLITAIFRNLIGLQTFGTFAPSLLALSFVMSDWRTGLVILVIVMVVGYIGRWAMDHMKLLMVPRIGLILTLVIILMTMAISIFDYLNLTPSANAVLLPTVIIAMLIERVFITEIEDGVQNVFKLLMGTFIVAVTCFSVLASPLLRSVVISFPELLFVVISCLILLGRYSGYRLSELKRFRDLVR